MEWKLNSDLTFILIFEFYRTAVAGYDPAYKYDLIFRCMVHNCNAITLYAEQNQTVDIILATLLLLGSVAGVQIGARFTNILKGEHLRLILSTIIILVSFKLLSELVTVPSDLYSIIIRR